MATIVRHKESGKHFVFLGTGFGAFKSARPGAFLGRMLPTEDEGVMTMVALGFPDGRILWSDSTQIEVVSVDGQPIKELLRPYYQSQKVTENPSSH